VTAAAGCNAIVGAGDYHVVEGGLAAAQCGQALPSPTDPLITSCLLSAGCNPFAVDYTISDCVTNDLLHAYPALTCLASAAACGDVYKCNGVYPDTAECKNRGTTSFCSSDNRAVFCDPKGSIYYVCNKCGMRTTADGGSIPDCIVKSSCSDTPNVPVCDPRTNDLYRCVNGQGFGAACNGLCSAKDDTCYLGGDGGPCNAAGSSCQGSTLQFCSDKGSYINFSCGTAGLTCQVDPSNSVDKYCVAPGCSIAQAAGAGCTEQCDDAGVNLTICVGGAPLTVDCTTAAGGAFTSCQSVQSKLLNKTLYQCVP
jgi:hypothetical protein